MTRRKRGSAMADSIRCPNCRSEIPLEEVILHQIEEELAARLTREVAAKEQEFAAREKEQLSLEVARRINEERAEIAADARTTAAEAHQLELRQKDLQVEQMQRQIKDLQESAEQTRAGLIGEAQEREIEDVLREKFRSDS